jgi:hypothetical protein
MARESVKARQRKRERMVALPEIMQVWINFQKTHLRYVLKTVASLQVAQEVTCATSASLVTSSVTWRWMAKYRVYVKPAGN